MHENNLNSLKVELKKHSAKGRFILIHGTWWFVPETYDVISRKYRLGSRILSVPTIFKLKKTIKLEKKRLIDSTKSEQLPYI